MLGPGRVKVRDPLSRPKLKRRYSCGNPQYGPSTTGRRGWPGFGAMGEPGPLGDSWKLFHEPVALAEELVALGYSGLKVWPFDQAARQYGPARIPHHAIEASVQPLRTIRDKDGYVSLPQGSGLGVRLNPDLFKPGRPGYRISRR